MSVWSPRGWWLVGALGWAAASGCSPYGGGAFACTDNAQCAPNGTCASGFCAFPDSDCPSMLKYGESSGPNSGTCVGATIDVDAGIDAEDIAMPDGAICYGNSVVHACFASTPTGAQNLTAGTLNTTTSTQCATLVGANANAWCVIAGSSITVTGTLNVIGNRPLVLISTATIDVNGTIDVASHRIGGALGPASDVAGCNAGTAPTGNSGGAGGSLGGVGGAGPAGNTGAGGAAGAKLTPTALRGGCPGQKGAGGGGGTGGHGGGAVWLYAATGITVGGSINASGSSGDNAGANSSSGGGAGGSGGYVGLESPSMTVSGSIFANGGAGGEGSGSFSTGNPGIDSPNVTTAANGGNGGSATGTDGGDGSLGATLDGAAGATCSGCISGGGGGGGAGIIKVVPPQTTGGQLSPPAS